MNPQPILSFRAIFAAAAVLIALNPGASAQTAPVDPVVLAKYDKNHDGRLDADEAAVRDADLGREAANARSVESTTPVVLSPFEVRDEGKGYYASNTMSGTRLNSKIEDLASSISVVTKEQMADFALLDINDIFLYEVGTEGTGTYTDFEFDRNGYPTDNTSREPNSSNRVRGVSSANIAYGNFETSGRVPIDPLNIESVEISRGPNANIFGLGNAGGTVNIVPASANLSRNRSQLQLRGDSHGGYRGSLELNRVLRKDTLALRGTAAYQHTGYMRKPSGTDSVRLNGMVKYRPFKFTTLTASIESYRNHGNMPNGTMPRDTLTAWRAAGSPTFNNLTRRLTLNGVAGTQAFAMGALPEYLIATGGSGITNSTMFIDQGGAVTFWGPTRATATTSPEGREQQVWLINTNAPLLDTRQPLFAGDPSVTDKSVYDWSKYNLAGMNYLSEQTTTTNITLEQFFIHTDRQGLALQAGFFGENSYKYRRDLAGGTTSQRAVGALYMDVNEFLPDGTANPNLLRPYIGLWTPRTYEAPLENRTYRGQLAYRLDLRKEKSAWQWLGMQQATAYLEYKSNISRRLTYEDSIISDHAWLPPGTRRGSNVSSLTNNYFRYYVGDAVGQNVDYGTDSYPWGTYPYRWGNALTGAIRTEPATMGPAVLSGGGGSNNYRILKTHGVVLQSFFLKDRLVTTLGLRKDRNYNRAGTPLLFLPDGINADADSYNQWAAGDWTFGEGTTKTTGVVVKPLRWLSLHANTSDSFQPAVAAQDLLLQPVADPRGEGKDYGFSMNLFRGKLVLRFNQYETRELRSRNGESATLVARTRAIDFDNGSNTPFFLVPNATRWVQRANPGWSNAQVMAEVARITQLDPMFLEDDPERLVETEDKEARGRELEIFFNPNDSWTVKFNLTEQESINARIAPALTSWIDRRLPVWQGIVDPETGRPWFTTNYGTSNTAQTWLANNVLAPLNVARAVEGKSRPQIRKYKANLLTSYRLAGITDHRLLKRVQLTGAIRWEDKGAIGYYGLETPPAIVTQLDPNRPIYDKARMYIDAGLSYRTRLFRDRIGATFQLNARNLNEGGRLQPIKAYPDGRPNVYRIIDPRQFILTTTFEL